MNISCFVNIHLTLSYHPFNIGCHLECHLDFHLTLTYIKCECTIRWVISEALMVSLCASFCIGEVRIQRDFLEWGHAYEARNPVWVGSNYSWNQATPTRPSSLCRWGQTPGSHFPCVKTVEFFLGIWRSSLCRWGWTPVSHFPCVKIVEIFLGIWTLWHSQGWNSDLMALPRM
jgi:hypothetical protein